MALRIAKRVSKSGGWISASSPCSNRDRNRSSRVGISRGARSLEITTRVACGDFFAVRDEALKAHATQVDPEGFWFRCPIDVQQAVWPTEDYHLARSVVDSELPEDDLFAGIRESVCL